jgi:Zn-dependent peptidase ImmA (M78 family)
MPVKEVRGFSLNGGPVPIIVVSSSDSVLARIFTLFHELAHLLLNSVGMCLPSPDQEASTLDIEPFCNRFSGSLLIPYALLDSDPSLSALNESVDDDEVERRIQRAAKDYKVSRFVILFRLLAADTLSRSRVRRVLDRWNREPMRPSKSGPQPPANKALNQYGTRFAAAVLDAQARNAISASDAASYLSLKIKHFQTLARLVSTYGRG